MSQLPEPLPEVYTAGQPAHHRPPNIVYDQHGRPMHFTIGQPPAPQQIVVQAPAAQGLSPELQRLIILTFLILAVIVVCTGALIAIVVMMGATLMGIIGTVGQNLPFIGVTLVGVIVAAGWAASKMKGLAKSEK